MLGFGSGTGNGPLGYREELNFLKSIAGSGIQVIYDVGANEGKWSKAAMSAFPNSTVYAFEPNPNIFIDLEKKQIFGKNGKLFQVALGSATESRNFHYNSNLNKEKKIMTCISGKIFLVIIDLRVNSKTYLKKEIIKLNSKDKFSVLIPSGCANAYLSLKDNTIVHYQMSDFYSKKNSKGFNYKDNNLNIKWPSKAKFISKKDLKLKLLDKVIN
jgi:dTDP-4-dehydrorhamnose 3,5-epimerase